MSARDTEVLALTLLVGLTACRATPPTVGMNVDSGMAQPQPIPPPVINALPTATPQTSTPVSGTTQQATLVTISGGAQAVTVPVLPGGQFCAQVPLLLNANNALKATSLSGDGRVSAPATATITQNPGAALPGQLTCSGEPPYDGGISCNDPVAAVCASQCNACVLDAYQPNFAPDQAPSVNPGTYQLNLCPCHDEWFALVAPQGALIDAQLQTNPAGQLGIELRRPLGIDGGGTVIASATTQSGVGEMTFVSDVTELYDLRIFTFQPDGGGAYALTLNDFTVVPDAGPVPDGGLVPDGGADGGLSQDGGPAVFGPCLQGPGLDTTECNPLTPYCDTNRAPPACVSGASDTAGEPCTPGQATSDQQCNFGLAGTQVVCASTGTCVVGHCHSNNDCPSSSPTCDTSSSGGNTCF